MNEPQPGSIGSTPAGNGYQASSQDLYPFYTRAIEALTGVRDGRPTCPAGAPTSPVGLVRLPAAGVGQPAADLLRAARLPEPGGLLGPGVRTLLVLPQPRVRAARVHLRVHRGAGSPGTAGQAGWVPAQLHLRLPDRRVRGAGDALGGPGDRVRGRREHRSTILANELAAQEATQTGGTLWAWKGLSKVAGRAGAPAGSTRATRRRPTARPARAIPKSAPSPADLLIPSRQRLLMRVSPTATAGRLGAYAYDPVTPHLRHGRDVDGGGTAR